MASGTYLLRLRELPHTLVVLTRHDNRINGYEFNLDAMTSFEGDTGPYLQYAHARLCSIMRKVDIPVSQLQSADLSLLTEQHATELVRILVQFPDVVFTASRTLEPNTILTYLFRMTHALSSSYEVLHVVRSEPEVKKARMALYGSARQVLWNGMRLLGLSPVQRCVFTMPFTYSFRFIMLCPGLIGIGCSELNFANTLICCLGCDMIRCSVYLTLSF